jgi:hypothetical protein
LCGERGTIEEAGAQLVFIGNGSPAQARDFRAANAPGCEVYTDPSRATYTALGAQRGVAATVGPSAARAALRTLRGGFRQSSVQGDAWQLGGVIVVLPGDHITYSHLSRHAGDHPPTDEVLAAVRAAAVSASD